MKSKFLKYILIYLLIAIGYVFLYVLDVDALFFPEKEQKLKSNVEFIYQQF